MKRSLVEIHLAVLLWGFTGILGKAISLQALPLVWYRMLFTAVILALIITYRKEWVRLRKEDMKKVVSIGILYAVHWIAFYAALKLANASIAMVCLATASVFTALLDPLIYKGKFDVKEILLGCVALVGVGSIYFFQDAGKSATMVDFKLGMVCAVVASIISAVFTVMNKPLAALYPARNLVFYEMCTGWGFITLLAPFYFMYAGLEMDLLPVGMDYLWLFLLAYCCTVWGQSLAMSALKGLSAFTVTLSVNLEPVYGILLAFLIYRENEQLGLGFYVGMGLIFASMLAQILLLLYGKTARKST